MPKNHGKRKHTANGHGRRIIQVHYLARALHEASRQTRSQDWRYRGANEAVGAHLLPTGSYQGHIRCEVGHRLDEAGELWAGIISAFDCFHDVHGCDLWGGENWPEMEWNGWIVVIYC